MSGFTEIFFDSYYEFETKESPYRLKFFPGKYMVTLIAASGGYTPPTFQVNYPGKGGLVKGVQAVETLNHKLIFGPHNTHA